MCLSDCYLITSGSEFRLHVDGKNSATIAEYNIHWELNTDMLILSLSAMY